MPGRIEVESIHGSKARGFTLIELLAVIGLITVILGVLSFSLEGGGTAVGLQNGQAMVSSLVSAARGKAALTGNGSRLVLVADADHPNEYLRCLAVLYIDQSGSWVQNDDLVYLPESIGVVPPDSVTVPVVDGIVWGTAEVSEFSSGSTMSVEIDGHLMDCWYVSFTSRGTVDGSGLQIVLSTVQRTADGFAFDNPSNMRGLRISSYGVQTLIDGADGFPSG
ncbi:MAG: type II secretion system protein [Opitutaceae bacterium]